MSAGPDVRDYVLRLEEAVVAYAITCEMYECHLAHLSAEYEKLAIKHDVIPDPNIVSCLHRLRDAVAAVTEKFPVEELGVCHASMGEV